ncbi:Succinyl-CoA ligase [ADP-forming] subunit alpha, mitochondrial [Cytospora mali]|uniref:Succinyl-CoA ligase [ADP-forming] subunit alpha, mitochondrial n=1 Tax=Cytospora mali TaxID=578113 RepID=A0A194VNM3_CYTMA|nr:Succinyl-CoA ligase [ADP-forming] subunit alpha, mitochondrial [Valsa mali]
MRHHIRPTARGHAPISPSRYFTTSPPRHNYAATLKNLRIGRNTRVIFQGFTGRQATANAQESIKWGTNIVGGVVPDRQGEHLGLPVLPSVRKAMEQLKPDATGIYVPASRAAQAIEDAIEAEVPLIVAVAEHVPLHDMLRVHSMLRTQTKSRLVGPNSPGIINAAEGENCRIGFQPLGSFSPGCVGIAARSGTLSYEAVAATTRAKLGQSLCIGVGGDILPGTDLVEALQVLEADPNTKGIALIGEIGGDGEIMAAQWIKEYHDRTPVEKRKPIVAVIAGKQAPLDRVMGHAGAFWLPGEPHPNQKIAALKNAGAVLVSHPAYIGRILKDRIKLGPAQGHKDSTPHEFDNGASFESVDDFARAASRGVPRQQHRGLHTSTRGSGLAPSRPRMPTSSVHSHQARSLHLDRAASQSLLRDEGKAAELQFQTYPIRYLALDIDRTTRSQCLVTAVIYKDRDWRNPASFNKILLPPSAKNGVLSLKSKDSHTVTIRLIEQLQIMEHESMNYRSALGRILRDLTRVFYEKEARHVSLQFTVNHKGKQAFTVQDMRIDLDDSAYRSGGRLAEVHEAYGALEARDPGARQAEKSGIVYHRLNPRDRSCNIGTLVNGAGLAMNTVDALADAGGKAANFLDTGGKANSDTVKKAIETILQDDRVKVIFVNIFGGLTRGEMIAAGLVHAYKNINIKVPIVVRIRGTNEWEARKAIEKSRVPIYAYMHFDEAAAAAIDIAKGAMPPVQEPYLEGEDEVSELKDAIQLAAETIVEKGGLGGEITEATHAEESAQAPAEEAAEAIVSEETSQLEGEVATEATGSKGFSQLPVEEVTEAIDSEATSSEATSEATNSEESSQPPAEEKTEPAEDGLAQPQHAEQETLNSQEPEKKVEDTTTARPQGSDQVA